MFIHVPKAAGSSIEVALGLIKARTVGKFDRLFIGEGRYSFGHICVTKRIKNGAIPKDFYESAFKFCFCRNPFDRAVSHYHYARLYHSKPVRGHMAFPKTVLFDEFTRTLGNYKKMFQQQHLYTDGIKFDFIGRFENLYSDLEYVSNKTGIQLNMIHKNGTQHEPYWTYYTEETAQNVAEFYKEDFEIFGYDNNLYNNPVISKNVTITNKQRV